MATYLTQQYAWKVYILITQRSISVMDYFTKINSQTNGTNKHQVSTPKIDIHYQMRLKKKEDDKALKIESGFLPINKLQNPHSVFDVRRSKQEI